MTHSEIRHLLAGIMAIASLFVLGRTAMAYAARKLWRGTALMGGGFLLMGLAGLTTESGSPGGGTLRMFATALVIAGSVTERRERRMGVGLGAVRVGIRCDFCIGRRIGSTG